MEPPTPTTSTRRRVLRAAGGAIATAGALATAGCTTRVAREVVGSGGGSESDSSRVTPQDGYDRATVVVVEEDGSTLARVRVRVSDTVAKRYLGLSDTESLGEDEGMLFVHESEGEYAYVMREMDFPLDILFADSEGVVTTVHEAPLPPEGASGGDLKRYRGTGKFVLEVPMGYAADHGIEPGDRFEFEGLDSDLV